MDNGFYAAQAVSYCDIGYQAIYPTQPRDLNQILKELREAGILPPEKQPVNKPTEKQPTRKITLED